MAIRHNYQGTIITGADEAAINAQCEALGIPLAFPPAPPMTSDELMAYGKSQVMLLPDADRALLATPWITINGLYAIGDIAGLKLYFEGTKAQILAQRPDLQEVADSLSALINSL